MTGGTDLRDSPVDQLRSRMGEVLSELDVIFLKIGPDLQRLGSLRIEAASIYEELVRRGVLRPSDVPASADKRAVQEP